MPFAALLIALWRLIGLFYFPRKSFAFEQHSSLVRASMLVPKKKKCKINVS
jgi:hypothetical protein